MPIQWHRLFGLLLTDFFAGSPFAVEIEHDLSVQQQLLQRYKREGIVMPYTMEDFAREYAREHLKDLSPEERLEGLSLEERLKGLSPEELLEGLSPEAIEGLLKKWKEEGSSKPRKRRRKN